MSEKRVSVIVKVDGEVAYCVDERNGTVEVKDDGATLSVNVQWPSRGQVNQIVTSSRPCMCPVADMLRDGWKCTCGASK